MEDWGRLELATTSALLHAEEIIRGRAVGSTTSSILAPSTSVPQAGSPEQLDAVQVANNYVTEAQAHIRELGHRLTGAVGVEDDVLRRHRAELDRLRLCARQVGGDAVSGRRWWFGCCCTHHPHP
jgi:hypothetical protein